VASVKKVLVLDQAWLATVLGTDCVVGDADGFRRCVSLFQETREHGVLERFLEENPENRVIYLGDDGVLARVFGDRVLDLYGSRTRLRCNTCGHRWWLDEGYRRCPVCGSEDYGPDYTAPGQRPRQRRLLEALYEVTSADKVFFNGLGEEPELIELLLLLIATKFAKEVAVIGRKPGIVPREIRVMGSLDGVLG